MSQTLTAYNPSLREKLAYLLAGGAEKLGAGINTQRAIVGKAKDAIDFVPGVGDAVGFNEAGRDIKAGNYGTGAMGMGLATLGLLPGAGDIASKAGKKLMNEAVQEAPKGIRAFHGSPHSFDKFSLDKIGTGEGAQAYGHGLYFAEQEATAQAYRDALKLNGYSAAGEAQTLKAAGLTDSDLRQLDPFLATGGDPETIVRDFTNWTGKKPTPELKQTITQIAEKRPKGSMYEVNINANPDDFLDWDKPLVEQPEVAKRLGVRTRSLDEINDDAYAIFNEFGQYPNMPPHAKAKLEALQAEMDMDPGTMTGEQFYSGNRDDLSHLMRTISGERFTREQSQALAQKGVPGIKYLDAGSRGVGDGSRNYVVFDDKLIDIVKKYGIAGASAMLGYNVLGGMNEAQAGELNAADKQFNGGGNMIEVELPDGSIAEFPEGTAPDVIKGALQKRFAAQQTVAPVVDQAAQDRAAYDELPWYAKAGQAADDVMRLAANGATFGYADKLAGYMSGDGTESERALTEQARNRAGSAAPVAEIGGSVLTAGGLAKNGLTLAGRGGTAAMTGLKGLAARAGLMGLEGEAFNKVSSMGYDQQYVPGLGFAAGAGGQLAGEGISAGLTKIGKAVGNYMAPAETRAAQEIYDAAQNVNPQAALAQLNDLGPDAMAVDVLGERGIAVGRRAANLSPDARETIESAVLGRKSMQNQRVVADLEKAAGLPVGNRMNVDALKKEAYDQVSPQINAAYEAARKAGYDLPREPFRSVLESPLGKEAYQNAEGALLNRAGASGQTSASELARLDQTKRFLDSAAKKAFRAGDDDLGSQAAALAKALRDQMDASIAGPEYAAARALRQQAYGTEGAFDIGETLASGRVPFGLPEQAGKVAAGDKAALAKGYAAKQAENLLNRGSTEGALNQLSTPMGREGFIAALGDKAPEIIKALGREKAFNRVAKGISGNSTTARQVAEMMGTGVGSAAAAGAMGYDMTTGGTMGLLAALLKKGGPALQRKFASDASRQVAPHLADLLTRKALPTSRPIAATAIEKLSEGSKQALVRALMMSGVLAGSQAGQP